MEHGEDDRRARITGRGEEPAGGIGDAAGEGVDGDGGPEGLAGEAAREIGEGPPGERVSRELLELAAPGIDLVVRQRDRGGVRCVAGDL